VTGRRLREHLDRAAAGIDWIAEVRGKGLMQAIETVEPGSLEPAPERAAEMHERCKQRGLLIGKGGLYGNVLRIAPPLTVTEEEIDRAAFTIAAVIGEMNNH
jgi:4-aminobutyrate aminotransferase-like enzyme